MVDAVNDTLYELACLANWTDFLGNSMPPIDGFLEWFVVRAFTTFYWLCSCMLEVEIALALGTFVM